MCLCFALLCVLSSFAIILKRKRERLALLLLPKGCLVLRLFRTVLWVGLRCLIVVFPDHSHLLFKRTTRRYIHVYRLCH